MNYHLHPTIARAIAPMAPPQSVVHQIIREEDRLAADRAANANKAERAIQSQTDSDLDQQQRYLAATGQLP